MVMLKAKIGLIVNATMFSVDNVVHQCLVLLVIVLEAFSRDFLSGSPREPLNPDDLAIVTESLEELKNRLSTWKMIIVEKSRKVKVSNTKVLISGRGLNTIKELIKFLCSIDLKDVRVNSLYYSDC